MHFVPHRLAHPADQLAVDEALLLFADEATELKESQHEFLRVWEFAKPTVVVGRSSRVRDEVDVPYCDACAIPIFRRCSGGASVVGGPGCLMYSLVLDLDLRPELTHIDANHHFVMRRLLQAVNRQLEQQHDETAAFQGTCDLTFVNRKFSGNSMRMTRHHVLYHGTILYDADLDLIARCLRTAPRQPDYRLGRSHQAFITNVPLDRTLLESDLRDVFDAAVDWPAAVPADKIVQLRQQRYDERGWNFLR
ncbi:lipoate--protein ligase family protein [Novipirellula artificiosorum]|uniref:Lipoate-protein ligase LplJ n=1 Tax=Novipirellula artificiosorum TaxID=2528016 RepID=A0A5C6DGY8_9BACT|nr:lipoate--protein ligase family protein [Novipirellula artificiosorum]TWU35107.1 Lipoate-protein ligase LplJ [Novipirellula artificiosorum]